MNPQDILRYVDSLHREKNIDKELVFIAIESALQTAAKRQYGEEADIIKERLVSGNENIKKYTSLVQDLKGTKS